MLGVATPNRRTCRFLSGIFTTRLRRVRGEGNASSFLRLFAAINLGAAKMVDVVLEHQRKRNHCGCCKEILPAMCPQSHCCMSTFISVHCNIFWSHDRIRLLYEPYQVRPYFSVLAFVNSLFPGVFARHGVFKMSRVGSGQEVFIICRVGSGRVERFQISRVGSGREFFKSRGSARVKLTNLKNCAGGVGSADPSRPGPTREV